MTSSLICDVCKDVLTSEYFVDEWGNKSHYNHKGIIVKQCDYCGRFISKNTSGGANTTSDGRTICKICLDSAVIEMQAAESQKMRVLEILKAHLFENIPVTFQIKLLNAQEMSVVSKTPLYATKGLAQSHFTIGILGNRKNYSHKIYVLSHLPREEFAGVLAHEILHLWLTNNNIILSADDIEGFCNIGSYLVYYQNGSEFSNVQLRRMERNMDPAYGLAYRRLRGELHKYGWKTFLNKVRNP